MLIMGYPQFDTQDDAGIGEGIPPIPEWQLDSGIHGNLSIDIDLDDEVENVFLRLRGVFHLAQTVPLPTTRLHDLTCFVVHRLLLSAQDERHPPSPISECIRYSIILYMLIIHGPTYYSHVVMLNTMVLRLMDHLREWDSTPRVLGSIDVWFLGIGLVASAGTLHYDWFLQRAQTMTETFPLVDCDDVISRIKNTLWLETTQGESLFRCHWDFIFNNPMAPSSAICFLHGNNQTGLSLS